MKKQLALFACAALALTALTACGGSSDEGGAAGTAPAASNAAQTQADAAYVYTANGVAIPMDVEAAPIIDALGEPASYYEAASCAFDGLDKFYTYGSFEVDTYPDGDTDRISAVILKDDMVETPEGVAIGANSADVIAAYGENTADAGTLIYSKGGSELWFVLQDDVVVSIEYHTTVLN